MNIKEFEMTTPNLPPLPEPSTLAGEPEPLGWFCDACGAQGGRKIQWTVEKPRHFFHAIRLGGPVAEWFPLYSTEALRLASPQGWQPIETVPKGLHGGVIVVSDGYVEEAWFDDERREWYPANTDYTDAHSAPIYPTFWMPLPSAPEATKGNGG